MRIADVRCWTTTDALRRPFVTARRRTQTVESVVVEVELDDGTLGQGTAAETLAVTGETAATMTDALHARLFPALPLRTEIAPVEASEALGRAGAGARSATAAVEIALHDAWARGLGVPLAEALGGDAGTTFAADMTISLDEPDAMAARAREATDAGHTVLKIKLGDDPEADLDRLRAVHAAAPGARLRLDANQGWSAAEAIVVIDRLLEAGLPVDLVEQPVDADDLFGLARVTAAVDVPIMADESVTTPARALEIVAMRAADLVNVKLAKCGGLRPAWRIAEIAHAAGIGAMVGSMMEPRVGVTAAAHLAAAHPAITLVDLDAPDWFTTPEPSGGYVVESGRMRLTGGDGLGLDRLRPP